MNGQLSIVLIALFCASFINSVNCCGGHLCSIAQRKAEKFCGRAFPSGLSPAALHCLNAGAIAPSPYPYALPIPIHFPSIPPPPQPSALSALSTLSALSALPAYPPPMHFGGGLPYGLQDDVEYIPAGYCKCAKRRHRYLYDC